VAIIFAEIRARLDLTEAEVERMQRQVPVASR
jgi:hypothetical protein